MSGEKKTSYNGILKSTSIIGGAQIIQISIGIIKNKVIAILLGPAGIGLIGIYQSIHDLVRNITSLGINMSGVRDVAEAKKSENSNKIGEIHLVLKFWSWLTGFFGFVIILVFCVQLSRYSFGDNSYAIKIAILSVTLFFTSFAQSNITLLQGLQYYKIIAKSNIVIALTILILSIPLYYIFGFKGIVPSFFLMPLVNFIVTQYHVSKLKIISVKINLSDIFSKGLRMTKLGIFMVINGFLATGTMLFIKSFISRKGNIEDVGLFQASWTISTSYIGIVLNAMLTDFFPRLSANNQDNILINKLTNEQSEITLILGAPLLVILMSFSKIIINILYSGAFDGAVQLLQWQIFASFLILISWPIGVIFLAKGKGLYSMVLDLTGSICLILIGLLLWNKLGIIAFGISALSRAFFSIFIVLLLSFKLTKFSFSKEYLRLVSIYSILFIVVFIISLLQIPYLSFIINIMMVIFTIFYSYMMLVKRVDIGAVLKRKFRK